MNEYEFKVIKTANDIEDICISYGICKILSDNRIKFKLKDNKSMYSIYTKEFDIQNDIFYNDFNIENVWNLNSGLNQKETVRALDDMNKFLSENIHDILEHLLNGKVLNYKKESAKGIGNCFYSLGVRASTFGKTLEISPIKKYLSFLGWIYGCSYCYKEKSFEITAILKPYNTDEIAKPFNFSYVDKETGDKKILTKIKKASEINMMSILYIETLKKYKMLSDEYSNVIFMQNIIAGQKPLYDKTTNIKIYKLSQKYLDDLLKKLTWSNVSEDVKDITARYVLNIDKYKEFSKLIKIYSKDGNSKINNDFKGEILSMYNEMIKKIYNDETINKIGKGFNRLLRDNKGFEIQTKLYNVANEKHLVKVLKMIIDLYSRNYKSAILNNDELNKLINTIEDKEYAKICSDAILSIGKVFIIIKK